MEVQRLEYKPVVYTYKPGTLAADYEVKKWIDEHMGRGVK